MIGLFASKAAANTSRKNQLSFIASRAFSAGPKPNPFNGLKTQLGSSAFYKLPAMGDDRLCKYTTPNPNSVSLRKPALLHQGPFGVCGAKLRRVQREEH